MSSKSKNNTRRLSATQLGNRHLIVFLWAMCSVLHPTPPQIRAVRDEIHSVLDSLRAGRLRESDIVAALAEEENILTDWARRVPFLLPFRSRQTPLARLKAVQLGLALLPFIRKAEALLLRLPYWLFSPVPVFAAFNARVRRRLGVAVDRPASADADGGEAALGDQTPGVALVLAVALRPLRYAQQFTHGASASTR